MRALALLLVLAVPAAAQVPARPAKLPDPNSPAVLRAEAALRQSGARLDEPGTPAGRIVLAGPQATDATLALLKAVDGRYPELSFGTNTRVTSAGFVHLERLTGVTTLRLPYCPSLGDGVLRSVGKMPSLETLEIGFAGQFSDAGLKPLGGHARLRVLRIFHPKITGAGLAHLAKCKALREIDVVKTLKFDPANNRHLLQFPDLERLDFSADGRVSESDLESLGRLKKLRHLGLNTVKGVTDDGLAHLAGLSELDSLGLADTEITDAGLAHVAKLTNLETALTLNGTQVTNAGVEHLKPLVKLRRLGVANTKVTHVGVEAIADALPELRSLSLGGVKTTSRSVAAAAGLKNLEELTIASPLVSDAGLIQLHAVKTLRRVNLTGSKTTPAGRNALREAVPGVVVLPAETKTGSGSKSKSGSGSGP